MYRIMLETDEPKTSGIGTHASKKRKMGERVVVAVKIEENEKRQQRSEGPPSDCWSWRKYGQKPIKGSPYPRGYYRCSTSKGCSAKKQVERCKTDASMLIVTYTSSHNHPSSAFSLPDNQTTEAKEINIIDSAPRVTNTRTMEQEKQQETELRQPEVNDSEYHFLTVDRVIVDHDEKNPFEEDVPMPGVLYEREPNPISQQMKSEENDFFDELDELPTSSFFTSLMKSTLHEDRVVVNPTWS